MLCAGDATRCAAGTLPNCDTVCDVPLKGTLEVIVEGVLSGKRGGVVRVGLASSATQWNRGQPVYNKLLHAMAVAPQAGQMRFSFQGTFLNMAMWSTHFLNTAELYGCHMP